VRAPQVDSAAMEASCSCSKLLASDCMSKGFEKCREEPDLLSLGDPDLSFGTLSGASDLSLDGANFEGLAMNSE
jgi:hypothetical protein